MKTSTELIRELLGDQVEIEIRKGLSVFRPSKELDIVEIVHNGVASFPDLTDKKILEEVIDFAQKKDKNPEPDENPLIPDLD